MIRVKEKSEKAGLKLNIQKTKILASGPITSWQIEWKKVEAVTNFIFLDSRIPVDGKCSHEIKRCLLLFAFWRKAMTDLDSMLKNRRHFASKGLYSQSYGFSSSHEWMRVLDHKAECQRIDAFQLWCWIRPLRVPRTARRANQSILKEINSE